MTDYTYQTVAFVQANNSTPPTLTNNLANTMTIQLSPPINLQDSEVALTSLNFYYSWPNISAAFGNNTLSYTLPVNAGTSWGTAYNVFTDSSNNTVIQNGLYSISDLNNALIFTFTQNGHYYLDANGNAQYPISLAVNPTGYDVVITLLPLLATLPAGWTSPGSLPTWGANTVARLNIPATSYPAGDYTAGQTSMSKVLGILPGSYPPTTVTNPSTVTGFQYQGTKAPQVSPIDSVNVCCNLVNASQITPVAASVIYNLAPQGTTGTLIAERPPSLIWLPITTGVYSQIVLYLQTSYFAPLPAIDPQMSASIQIRTRKLPSRQSQFIQNTLEQQGDHTLKSTFGGGGMDYSNVVFNKRPRHLTNSELVTLHHSSLPSI